MDLDLAGLPGWYADAACLGVPATLGYDPWFDGSDGALNPHAEAAEVCDGCPVREPCAAFAIDHGIHEGVWGGMTPKQRRQQRAA